VVNVLEPHRDAMSPEKISCCSTRWFGVHLKQPADALALVRTRVVDAMP
jgi:hypothetical protein